MYIDECVQSNNIECSKYIVNKCNNIIFLAIDSCDNSMLIADCLFESNVFIFFIIIKTVSK